MAKQPTQQEIQPLLNLLNSGQLGAAEKSAQSLLKRYPHIFFLHNVLGIALDGQQRHSEAAASYRKAIALQPNQADLYFNLGIALGNTDQLDQAAASYRKALNLAPGLFEALGNLGTILQKQGKLEEAIQCYRKALTIKSDALGNFNLATALRDQGLLAEAVMSYEEALRIQPDYVQALNNLGETLRDQGNMEQAIAYYQRALALDAQHAHANYNMAEFLYLAKRYEEAIPFFQRSGLGDWQTRMLYCLYKAGKFEEFAQYRAEVIKLNPHASPFLATLSTHYSINFNQSDPYNFCQQAMQFVYQNPIPELAPGSTLLQALLHDIEHADISKRVQGRLHYGIQSAGNLFKRPEASFQALATLIRKEFMSYREKYADADCELINSFPKQLEFTSSWYVKMQRGGHLTSHIHELGWLSGAVYLAMPKKKHDANEGRFEFGTDGDDYPKHHNQFPVANLAPAVGDIVLFPSSLFHRTIPFNSDEERICIAFDLKPDAG